MPQPLVKLGHLCGKNVTYVMSSRPISHDQLSKKSYYSVEKQSLHYIEESMEIFFLWFEGLINIL